MKQDQRADQRRGAEPLGGFQQMLTRYAQPGRVEQIRRRSAWREDPLEVQRAEATVMRFAGDHASGGNRAVALIQAEDLP